MFRALEKLTEGQAEKVLSTAKNENGFEAWRQLHLAFEPQLEAQRNAVLLDLRSIPPSTSIADTKSKLLELKVRIKKAEDILIEGVADIQKVTALLQILDPITKQHTGTCADLKFNQFFIIVMKFTNSSSSSMSTATSPPVAAVNIPQGQEEMQAASGYEEYPEGGIYGVGKGSNGGCNICWSHRKGLRFQIWSNYVESSKTSCKCRGNVLSKE